MQTTVIHHATPRFWEYYFRLPKSIQKLADANYLLLKQNPKHPSLQLKQIKRFWSVRIGIRYRALGIEVPDGIVWFWIGSHSDYDQLIA
jgi:hypothetical protein